MSAKLEAVLLVETKHIALLAEEQTSQVAVVPAPMQARSLGTLKPQISPG